MNKNDLNHKGAHENAQNHEKNTISSNSMTLKQLSKYLPDAKKNYEKKHKGGYNEQDTTL